VLLAASEKTGLDGITTFFDEQLVHALVTDVLLRLDICVWTHCEGNY